MFRLLALVIAGVIITLAGPAAAGAHKPLTVLVSIDGFKPDYLGKGNSPTLDNLAATGATAKGLRPAFPSVTFPNHYSMVTGLFPDHHGIVNNVMFDPTLPGRPFTLAARDVIVNPAWWNEGVPIWVLLHRKGKRSATMFWPGSDVEIGGVRPDDWLPYNDAMTSLERVDKLLLWIDRPDDQRADFATLYFSEVDVFGHMLGPDAPGVAEAVKRVDAALRHFQEGLERLGLRQSTTLVIVSDHGMSEVDRSTHTIDLKALLAGTEGALIQWIGPVAGFAVPEAARDAAVARLGLQQHMTCWPKAAIPARLHLGTHRRVPDVVCLADLGWSISDGRPLPRGQHGYDPAEPAMWGVFIAHGPGIAPARLDVVDNIEVYPLLCRLLGVPPGPNDAGSTLAAGLLPTP